MSDLRARLAEVVGVHYPCPCGKNELGYPHCVCGWTEPVEGDLWRDHLADVLLSLPGIAIVDSADIREAMLMPDPKRMSYPEHKAAISRLLAASNAAESMS